MFKRIFGGGALNALKGLESLGGDISREDLQALSDSIAEKQGRPSQPLPPNNRLSDKLLRGTGTKAEDLEAQGTFEGILQNVVSALLNPLGARDIVKKGVKGLGQAVARNLAGQGVRTGIQQVGLPESLATAGQLGTEFALGRRQGVKEGKIPKNLKEHTKKTYEYFKNTLKENEKGNAKALNPFLKESRTFHLTQPDRDIELAASNIVDKVKGIIDPGGNVDIFNAYELRKNLGQQFKTAPEALRPYIEQARDGLKNAMNEHSPMNPKFGALWKESSDLYKFDKSNSMISDYFQSLAPTKFRKALNLPIVTRVLDKIESTPRALGNEAVRRYYFKTIDAVLKDNPNSAIQAITQLNKHMTKDEMDEPTTVWKVRESNKVPTGWKPRKISSEEKPWDPNLLR